MVPNSLLLEHQFTITRHPKRIAKFAKPFKSLTKNFAQ
jgi:hypothetical protein